MKQTRLAYFFILFMCITGLNLSCDSDDEPTPTTVITSTSGLTIELTWEVNGNADGYTLMDLDLLVDNTDQTGSGDPFEYNSSNGSNTESLNIPNKATDGTYFLGVYLFEFELTGGLSKGTANYTMKIYETDDATNSFTVTGSINETVLRNDFSYANAKLIKTGSSYVLEKLSTTKAIKNGY